MPKKQSSEDINDYLNYNSLIKQRLSDWRNDLNKHGKDIVYSILAEQMMSVYKIKTSAQKIAEMFDTTSNREIKLPEIVALSHMLNIPLGVLCDLPNAPSIGLETPWIKEKTKSTGIHQLFNEFYDGEYYGYYFLPRHIDRLDLNGKNPVEAMPIEEVRIRIAEENGDSYVILEELTTKMDFYKKKELDKFILKGKLYLVERKNMAYSFISDNEGRRTVALMFEFKDHSKDILFYHTAAMMTISLNETPAPLFQKIAMFRIRQDLSNSDNETVVRGILSLNTSPIMIEDSVFEELQKDERLAKLVPSETRTYHLFSERALRDSNYNWSKENMEVILKLRKNSVLPAHEIVSEPEYFRNFIKEYQQSQF